MPVNKYALLRYRIIDRCIRHMSYPNIEALRQSCEDALYNSGGERVSRSTIEKDLYAMRNERELGYHAPIKFNKRHRGYEYSVPDFTLEDVPLNEEDIETIKFALNTLKQFKGVGMFKQLDGAISKVVDKTTVQPNWEKEEQPIQYVQFETSPENTGSAYLSDFLSAIQLYKVVSFAYKKAGSETIEERELCPLLLKEYRQRWYVLGTEVGGSRIKTFGLDRVQSVSISSEYFVPPKDFVPSDYFKYSFGITVSDTKPELITLAFENSQRHFVSSVPLHPTQNITEENKEEFIVELTTTPTFELYQALLAFGPSVRVISPASIRQELAERHQKAADKNYHIS